MASLRSTGRPAVSVIMPVCSVERYVAEAIRSVLGQSFTDFELIIVDDGGSDAGVAICQRLADHRTRILYQARRGLAGARNTGINAARGRFIALLDSDDVWEADKLARHVAHLEANPDVGVSYAGSMLIDAASRPLGIDQPPLLGAVAAPDVLRGGVIQNVSVPVVRAAALEHAVMHCDDAGRCWYFDETLRCQDVACWARIALRSAYRFEGIAGCLTRHRVTASDIICPPGAWPQAGTSLAANDAGFSRWHRRRALNAVITPLAR